MPDKGGARRGAEAWRCGAGLPRFELSRACVSGGALLWRPASVGRTTGTRRPADTPVAEGRRRGGAARRRALEKPVGVER